MARKRLNNTGLPDRVYVRRNKYYFVDKANKWHPLGGEYLDAMTEYARINQDNKPIFTMSNLFDKYQLEIIPTKAKNTQTDNLGSMKMLRKAFSLMRPDEITPQDIYAFMDARNAPVRANRDKALLSHIFKKAIRWGVVTINPCRDVESNPENPRDRLVENWEFWAVHDFTDNKTLRVAMKITGTTGLRMGKILSLNKKVHFKDGGIELESGKRGLKLHFELTSELQEAIDEANDLPGVKSATHLLHTRKGQPYTRSGFQAMWQRLTAKAVEDKIIPERFTFHDIRAMAGSETENDDLLGHKDKRTFHRVYRRKAVKVTPVSIARKKKDIGQKG